MDLYVYDSFSHAGDCGPASLLSALLHYDHARFRSYTVASLRTILGYLKGHSLKQVLRDINSKTWFDDDDFHILLKYFHLRALYYDSRVFDRHGVPATYTKGLDTARNSASDIIIVYSRDHFQFATTRPIPRSLFPHYMISRQTGPCVELPLPKRFSVRHVPRSFPVPILQTHNPHRL